MIAVVQNSGGGGEGGTKSRSWEAPTCALPSMSGDEASTSARAEQKPHGEDAHAQWRDAISGASAEGEGNKKLGRRHQRRRASLYDRIEPGRRKKEARAEQIRRERDELELKDATFSPKISTYSKKLGSRRGSIEDRLLKSEFERNSTVAELRRFHKANELEECTFKPTVRSHKGKEDKISTVEMPVFGRLLATSGGKEASTSGKREEATRGRKGETSEVFDRLWEKSLAKQGGREKGKRMWRRRESILPNGAPLSPFALDLRTPQRRAKKSKDPEPLHSSEWINNLYRDASVRRKVQRSREDAIDRQILDRTTCYNMTDHSFNIMMKTVSRETMLELDRQFPNSDYVEQVGFLDVVIAFEILPPLEKLGVRHLKYLPEEELLVERLWNILATGVCDGGDNAENVVMVVPKAAFHDFMILVECCILNGNMKQEMREIFNEQKNVENMEFWRVLETVAEVKLVNKQAYSNLRHDASSGVGEEEASLCKEVVSKKDRKSFLKFYKTQLSHPAKVKSKTDTLRAKLDAEELSHCTFAPKLYHRPKSSRRGQAVAVRKTDIVPSGTAELEKTMSKALAKPRTQKDSNPNQVTFAVLKYPNGYSKHLNRMDAPTEFDPHCFHYVPEKEKECMLSRIVFYFEFRYGGKFVSIPVHLRENPRKIALVIAKHLQIPKEVRPGNQWHDHCSAITDALSPSSFLIPLR